tara:strand:+ start:101 stop:379 length:279 start_codon:yes stop_codon:yes gene_type:complete
MIYNVKVLTPSLPRVPTSFIDTMPDIIETNIRGRTIIFNKIRNNDEIVTSIVLITNDSINRLGKKNRFRIVPKTMPASIEIKTFLVKSILMK